MKPLRRLATALALAGLCMVSAHAGPVQTPSGVRLVYLLGKTFYFADDHAHVLYQVEVNVPVGAFDISPDLSQIVFESGPGRQGDLRLLTVASGRVALVQRALTEKSSKGWREAYDHPKFSAAGNTVAYEVHRQTPGGHDSKTLAILTLATRKSRPLPQTETTDSGDSSDLWWSPDGSRILYNAGGVAGIVNVADGQATTLRNAVQLKSAGTAYGWIAPDCAAVGFGTPGSSRLQDLAVLNIQTGNARPLRDMAQLSAQDLPAFSALEVSGPLLLFQETPQRMFLYDTMTQQALATLDTSQARLVRSPEAVGQCE